MQAVNGLAQSSGVGGLGFWRGVVLPPSPTVLRNLLGKCGMGSHGQGMWEEGCMGHTPHEKVSA